MAEIKSKVNPLEIALFILLIIFALLFNALIGPASAVLIFIVWFDKNFLSRLKFHVYFGIELQTLSSILAGITRVTL